MYINDSIQKYLEDLAAKKPAPGGGSAAGLSGALAIALLEMVCNFTSGKEKYKPVQKDIEKHISSLKTIRGQFTSSIDEDVLVYSKIRDAFKKNDKKIIDKSLKDGYDISLKICKLAKDAMKIALDLSSKGNPNLITDVGCGAELLNAAFSSSIFNCKINLKSLEDKDFVSKESLSLAKLVKEIDLLYKDTIKKTNNIL